MSNLKTKELKEKTKMRAPILDPSFKYTMSSATDVQATWRKYGWVPPSELKAHNEKAKEA